MGGRLFGAWTLVLCSCSFVVSTTGLFGGGNAANDPDGGTPETVSTPDGGGPGPTKEGGAGLPESGAPDGATVPAGDGGVLYASAFEDNECDLWEGDKGTVVKSPAGHTGGACTICVVGAATSMYMQRTLPIVRPGKYRLEAWIRLTNGGPAAQAWKAEAILESDVESSGNPETARTDVIDGTWRKITVAHQVLATVGLIGVVLDVGTFQAPNVGCMQIDDVTLSYDGP